MIVATGLTKRYGTTLAVDDLSFEIRSGVVTGFLGPNGAGKSSAMRLMLDLDHGDGGHQVRRSAVPRHRSTSAGDRHHDRGSALPPDPPGA